MSAIRDLGIRFVEASADTECDPLYTPAGYLEDWIGEVRAGEEQTGVRVANLYSGHGTYCTLGLAHTDSRVAEHMLNGWLEPMTRLAGKLGAGLGFFCHAFPAAALREEAVYRSWLDRLAERLVRVARFGAANGAATVSVEQMYSPNQPPWRIDQATALIRDVSKRAGVPLYLTIDTGHQGGQRLRQRPGADDMRTLLARLRGDQSVSPGPQDGDAWGILARAAREGGADVERAIALMERAAADHAYLFAGPRDSDPYAWLAHLGCYSPILHLQQTTGESSSHHGFTADHNRSGIIDGDRVLKALAECYGKTSDQSMPPRCRDVYLTLELFYGPAEHYSEILSSVGESVDYWRRFVPKDGLTLDRLVGEGSSHPR
jgi:hypothetical protein